MLNQQVLMSSAAYFDDAAPINSYMNNAEPIKVARAQAEHDRIRAALESVGVNVIQVEPPAGCQDGVYTANWALVRGDKAIMARLPEARKGEESYAAQVLRGIGKEIIYVPENYKFSGQGDALPCGNYLFCGTNYRTDPEVHAFLAETLGYEVISLQAVPELDSEGNPVTNRSSGLPDSFFYDIDLAISVLRTDLIAWCPDAFTPDSQAKIRALPINQIEVSLEEAKEAFACNLVSTGSTVVMSGTAPILKAAVESYGLNTICPDISELKKGGGYIRCTSLTLDNS